MKPRYISILLILLVAAVLAVSGCSGSNTAGNATATPAPGTHITATSAPAQTTGGMPSTAAQLFNLNRLHSYKFRMTSTANGQTQSGTYEMGYTDEIYSGVPAKHTRMSFDVPASGSNGAGEMTVDIYTSKADNSTLGGHMKMVANGQAILDMDIPAGQASSYTSNDIATSSDVTNDGTLTNMGAETISIDGKTYACTKYTYTTDEKTYTVWHTPQAPIPVKYQWTASTGDTGAVELLSWS